MANADERKKLYRDNKGSAMVMVIVIIAFIAILVSVLMFVSFAGYQMRAADRHGKDNFYTAETVLDEINVGLQSEISAALNKAYGEVMTNFALYRSANERNKKLHEIYYAELKERLWKSNAEQDRYSVAKLQSYLSADSLGDGDGTRDGFLSHGATYGAIVESNLDYATEGEKYQMEVDNSKLLLKDLKVSYVDESGYISIISTDIRISLPSFNFSQASALPSLDSCSLIADDTLLIGNTTAGGNIVIKGDVYAGQMFIGTPSDPVYSAFDKDKKADEKTPLTLPTLLPTRVAFGKADDAEPTSLATVVSRENIEIAESSAIETQETELWAQNMTLTSASADINGTVNLKDDFTLSGKDSKAVLEGEYNGFGYIADEVAGGGAESGDGSTGSGEAADPEDSTDTRPDSSSAIIINGRGSSLDLSGLERMTISGRAYVSTAHNAADASATEQEKKNNTNIMMGESVAVKSNQLIYLAPSEAVGCRIDVDGTIGASEFGCNPLTLEQYEEIIDNPDQYCLLDGSRRISVLGYRSLNEYISQENVAGGGAAYVPEIVFKQTNAGPLVYCYLRFKDEDAANKYFIDYYNINSEKVDQYTQLYAREIKMADELLYLNIEGNMLTYEGAEGWSILASTESTGTSQQAKRMSALKDDVFKSLSAKLMRTSNQLTNDELDKTAFQNIMDETEIEIILHEKGAQEVRIDTLGASPDSMILTKNDYVVDDHTPSSVKMIVSLGNVTVKKDFMGLIIAKGNLTVEAGASLTIEPLDADTFTNILSTKIDELSTTREYRLLNIFTDGINYVNSGNTSTDMGTQQVSYVDLISYEKWSKK
ncbi:MAG: hypothetical protein HDR04_19230 [Lachnospiraceae bacterium]|nr:hypothetical protein [Lachnospiraceae bacterium]